MLLNSLFLVFSILGLRSDRDSTVYSLEHPYLFQKYKDLLVDVREYYIKPVEAKNEFRAIMQELRKKYRWNLVEGEYLPMVFPLAGSSASAVGGRNGSGFYVRNFDLFDHRISGSHPAHDIFIYDRNQDCIDDSKESYIDVVSVGNGIVLAVESNWQEGSDFKGGNYIWIYDIERGGLWYYAHNRVAIVQAGQKVKPGDKIGEVGRSGFNASKSRSDTHLHLMYLELDEDFYPHPVNYYEWLKDAQTIYQPTTAEEYINPPILEKIENNKWSKIKPIEGLTKPQIK